MSRLHLCPSCKYHHTRNDVCSMCEHENDPAYLVVFAYAIIAGFVFSAACLFWVLS